MVVAVLPVQDPHDAELFLLVVAVRSPVLADVDAEVGLDVDQRALHASEDGSEATPLRLPRPAAMTAIVAGDHRVAVRGEPGEEVPSLTMDPGPEAGRGVALVEQEQDAPHPGSGSEGTPVVEGLGSDPVLEEFGRERPDDGVDLDGRPGRVRAAATPEGREPVLHLHHGRIEDDDVAEEGEGRRQGGTMLGGPSDDVVEHGTDELFERGGEPVPEGRARQTCPRAELEGPVEVRQRVLPSRGHGEDHRDDQRVYVDLPQAADSSQRPGLQIDGLPRDLGVQKGLDLGIFSEGHATSGGWVLSFQPA